MKKMLSILLLMLMALALFTGAAVSEGDAPLYSMPERGVLLRYTQEDADAGLSLTASIKATADLPEVPVFEFVFNDYAGLEETLAQYSEEDLANEEKFFEIFMSLYAHIFPITSTVLYEKEYYDAQTAAGKTPADLLGDTAVVTGENDGYVYVTVRHTLPGQEDEAVAEKLNWASERAQELLSSISYQPVVFAPGEFADLSGAFPAFSTQDLAGNPVTQDVFSGKTLTVVNIWGTFCNPCINEMPELAQWDAELPDDVQIIGLVSDLSSADDAATLETALDICEATGVTFPSLIANADFAPLLSGVVGVPTTLFVDGSGMIVGEPIVGANVPAYKQFVEDYLNAQ